MVTLTVKGKSGQITDLQVEELISIDGQRFRGQEENVRDAVLHMEGRVVAIESLLAGLIGTAPKAAE